MFSELLRLYATGLKQDWYLALIGVAVALALSLPAVRQGLARLPRGRAWVLGLVVAGGLVWAWSLRWLCDDAYISFRYTANLVHGHGMVWNPGERVEGYTNFLWAVLMAPFIALGIDPGQPAIFLGLACFAAVIVLVARLERRLGPERAPTIVPLGAILAAASYPMVSFATSGMETMFITLMAVLAVERAHAGRPLSAGLAGIAGVMAHPDQAILYVALGAVLLTYRRWRDVVAYAAPFLLIYLPYFFIRWRYYGDPYPNTYYAKSADQAYFAQGFRYIAVTFVTAGLWAVLVGGVVGLRRCWSTLPGRYALMATPLFIGYVAKVGGDFMQGRLLCPILPVWFALCGVAVRELLAEHRFRVAAALSVLLVVAALPVNVFERYGRRWHVTDERGFYPLESVFPIKSGSSYFTFGNVLYHRFTARGVKPKMAIGGVGMVGYYSRLPVLDLMGLNDREIAHKPIVRRGMPGHEKGGGPGRILSAGVDLSDAPVWPAPFSQLSEVTFDGFRQFMVHYDPAVVEALRAPPAGTYVDMKTHLREFADQLQQGQPALTTEELACRAAFYGEYYFSRNEDRELRDRLGELIGRADPVMATELLSGDVGRYERVGHFGFGPEESALFRAEGTAFAGWPSAREAPGQQEVVGNVGPFLNSYLPGAGDAPTGKLVSRSLTLEGDAMTLVIGGGRDPERLRVSLVVDGKRVASATGCESEFLSRRAWNIAPWKGKSATLEIVDDSSGGWGHLLVDEIAQWRRR